MARLVTDTETGEDIDLDEYVLKDIEPVTEDHMVDPGRTILELMVREIIRRLLNEAHALKAADFEMIRKFSQDNSVTLVAIRRGDFGDTIKRAEEEFAWPVQ